MERLSNSQLQNFLDKDENTSIDFKRDQYKFINATKEEKSELLKDILAFANSWRENEAYIVIGIEEIKGGKNKVVGIEVNKRFDDANLQQFIKDKINRKIKFLYEEYELEDKIIGIIRIPKKQRPFYAIKDFGKVKKDIVYHRLGSSTAEANPQEIYDMGRQDFLKEIEEDKPLDIQRIDKFMNNLVKELKELSPDFSKYNDSPSRDYNEISELIIDSLNNSEKLVIKFTKICQEIAKTGNLECAERLYEKFSDVIKLVNHRTKYCYFKMIFRILYVIYIHCLIKKRKWELINKILEKIIYFEIDQDDRYFLLVDLFCYFYADQVYPYNQKSDYLEFKKYFENSSLNNINIINFQEYEGTILFLFLFLKAKEERTTNGYSTTTIYNNFDCGLKAPKWIKEAIKMENAKNLSFIFFKQENIERLRAFLRLTVPILLLPGSPGFRDTVYKFDFDLIGTI